MSVDYYLACHECRKILHVAQDGIAGFSFYSSEPACMTALRLMLANCLMLHRKQLAFVKEQGPEWAGYDHITWPGELTCSSPAPSPRKN